MKKSAWRMVLFTIIVLMMTTTAGMASSNSYEPVPEASNQQAVYIHSLDIRDGQLYLDVDPITWYEGEEADKVFRERVQDPEMTEAPDGYYIVNDTEEHITLSVDEHAEILLQIYDRTGQWEDVQIVWNEKVALSRFGELFANDELVDMKWFPYHITVKDGVVVKVIQQYIP